MKKLTKMITTLLVFAIVATMFTGCAIDTSKKEYQKYDFNETQGDLVAITDSTFTLDIANNEIILNGDTNGNPVKLQNNEILINDVASYFYNGYYVVRSKSDGAATFDMENKVLIGTGVVNGTSCNFNQDKKILDNNGEVIGKWSVDSNYATIYVDGVVSRYLIFSKEMYNGEKEAERIIDVKLYSDFYSSTVVPKKPVESTDFDVETNYLYNGINNQIQLKYRVTDYEPELVTYRIVDDGGYVLNLSENGDVYFNQFNNTPKSEIIISINVDGIVKEISFTPVYFGMSGEEMVQVEVGDEIDLISEDSYDLFGVDIKNVNLVMEIIQGEDLIQNENNLITFKETGSVVVRARISFVLDNKINFIENTKKFEVVKSGTANKN